MRGLKLEKDYNNTIISGVVVDLPSLWKSSPLLSCWSYQLMISLHFHFWNIQCLFLEFSFLKLLRTWKMAEVVLEGVLGHLSSPVGKELGLFLGFDQDLERLTRLLTSYYQSCSWRCGGETILKWTSKDLAAKSKRYNSWAERHHEQVCLWRIVLGTRRSQVLSIKKGTKLWLILFSSHACYFSLQTC